MSFVKDLKNKVLSGDILTEEEAYSLLDADTDELFEAAAEVNSKMLPREFDSCSIINARSGRCSEDCKWCAQSHCHHTGCAEYLYCDEAELERLVADAAMEHPQGSFAAEASTSAAETDAEVGGNQAHQGCRDYHFALR